jgi:hypothetical protein
LADSLKKLPNDIDPEVPQSLWVVVAKFPWYQRLAGSETNAIGSSFNIVGGLRITRKLT